MVVVPSSTAPKPDSRRLRIPAASALERTSAVEASFRIASRTDSVTRMISQIAVRPR